MNGEKLRKAIDDKGIKITALANKMGISRQSLYSKIKGTRVFDQGEMLALKTSLNMSDKEFMSIFFGSDVEKLPTKEKV